MYEIGKVVQFQQYNIIGIEIAIYDVIMKVKCLFSILKKI